MSNIYIQEPPALGKVLLKTSVGDIDLELWTKEAPKACRNFIQLCMEGYYNGTIFHRVVPDFIVQGGDPKGDGTGGESVFGGTFKDEFHSRLRFNRRGLVAMANAGKDDNGSQFFFTLNATPELQNKHTIFAKVTGETVFNMIKLAEGLTDQDDRPLYPHKIISSQVLVDPFGDIVPRVSDKAKDSEEGGKKKKKRDKTGVKNFGLLSFGVEAEEEEDQSTEFRGKPKSTHDVLDDPKLSRLTALEVENDDEGAGSSSKVIDEATVAAVNSIRDKLQAKSKGDPKKNSREIDRKAQDKLEEKSDEEEVEEYYLGKDKIEARKKQAEEIRGQIRDLKREMSGKKASDIEAAKVAEEKADEKKPDNELIQDFEQQQEKYKKMKEDVPTKGVSRSNLPATKPTERKPWVKNLYENTGHYPDNYTDVRFLEQMRINVNIQKVSYLECFFGSCRLTYKVSACVLYSVLFTYLYNEWATIETVFGASCALSFFGYLTFLIARYNLKDNSDEKESKVIQNSFQSSSNGINNLTINKEENAIIDKMFENSMKNCLKRNKKKKHTDVGSDFKIRKMTVKTIDNSITCLVYGDLKTVLIFLVFGYIVSPTLHTLTDTVSTDTIFATAACMMIVHLIFSDYGISAAIVSNSLSINAAIFASICLSSRLSNAFHAFVLISVAVQCFVLSPILIKMILHTRFAIFFFILTTLAAFVSLWSVSMTLFYFFLLAVCFINIYCPILFVRWQKYKDNIYGPWDEAVVHDSDDIEECIGLGKAS